MRERPPTLKGRQTPRLAVIIGKSNPPGKAVQEIDEAGARWNMERSPRGVPPLRGSAGAPIAVHAQPELFAPCLYAVGSGESFEDSDGVNRGGWHDPLVGPTVVVSLLFENRPDHHHQFGRFTGVGHSGPHTTGLQVHNLANPWTHEVRDHYKARRVEHVQKLG
jgi:hypothetical protein